jgi:opacity protein-like surface antigen
MVQKCVLAALSAVLFSSVSTVASAADIIDPPVVTLPEYQEPVVQKAGSWYIRGDLGYSLTKLHDIEYVTGGAGGNGIGLLRGDLNDSYFVGAGIGYDTGHYLRYDLTLDYLFKADFKGSSSGTCTDLGGNTIDCDTTDTSSLTAMSLMSNAYVDLGHFNGITPYIGAGIGGTHVQWGDLHNKFNQDVINPDEKHKGHSSWRFTYALMAGASYDVTDCLALDAGYRYRRVLGGKMFGIGDSHGSQTGPGYDHGIDLHDFKVGARYKFGGNGGGGCGGTKYLPEPEPIDYKPIYK